MSICPWLDLNHGPSGLDRLVNLAAPLSSSLFVIFSQIHILKQNIMALYQKTHQHSFFLLEFLILTVQLITTLIMSCFDLSIFCLPVCVCVCVCVCVL